jgi:hypothetical protein
MMISNNDKVHDVEFGEVVDNVASTGNVTKKLKSMVTVLSIISVLLIVCLSGVSAADQIKSDGLQSGTGRTSRTLKDVLSYYGKTPLLGEDGKPRKLAACFATTEASTEASAMASAMAASSATGEATNAASAMADAGASAQKSAAEYDAVYASVYVAVYDATLQKSALKDCGTNSQGMGNTKCNRFFPIAFFYGSNEHKCCAIGENLIVNDNGVFCKKVSS